MRVLQDEGTLRMPTNAWLAPMETRRNDGKRRARTRNDETPLRDLFDSNLHDGAAPNEERRDDEKRRETTRNVKKQREAMRNDENSFANQAFGKPGI